MFVWQSSAPHDRVLEIRIVVRSWDRPHESCHRVTASCETNYPLKELSKVSSQIVLIMGDHLSKRANEMFEP